MQEVSETYIDAGKVPLFCTVLRVLGGRYDVQCMVHGSQPGKTPGCQILDLLVAVMQPSTGATPRAAPFYDPSCSSMIPPWLLRSSAEV